MPKVEVTPDGWAVPSTFWQYYRFVTDHEPPRPGAVAFQLRVDARNWKPVAFWVVGGVLIVAGAVAGRWDILVIGVFVIAAWAMMFANAVRTVRNYPVVVGVIDTLTPHPQVPQFATARAVTADGRTIPVAAATALVRGFLAGNGRAEVLFLHDPRSAGCWVLAARPRPAESTRRRAGGCRRSQDRGRCSCYGRPRS